MNSAARWTLIGLGAAVGALAVALLVWGLASLFRATTDFVLDTWRTATFIGPNAPKVLALAAVGIVLLLAFPLALADGVSSVRFRRAQRELLDARPASRTIPYEGPEGDGVLFEGPEGRLLLLRPPGGLGKPRTVALPPPPEPADVTTA